MDSKSDAKEFSTSIDALVYRKVVGRFATGVTVVTCSVDGVFYGSTVQSFSSISLSPPLIMVSLSTEGRTARGISQAEVFAVSILSDHQAELSRRFADPNLTSEQRFSGVGIFKGKTGSPVIEGSIAYVEAGVDSRVEAGDHTIFLGRVLDAEILDAGKSPLLYYSSSYGGFRLID